MDTYFNEARLPEMKPAIDGNVAQSPIKQKIRRFYDIGSPFYSQIYGEHIHDGYYLTGKESKGEAQENLTKYIAEKARITKGERVLDVGCGVGGSSIWLAKRGAITTGITLSPVQVEIARKRASKEKVNSQFLLMDAEQMDLQNGFDVVWLVGALTHFEAQEQFVRQAARLLDKKGRLVIFDWMADEGVTEVHSDRRLKLVLEGMLLPDLHSMNAYLGWLIDSGFRLVYAEDITSRTAKTWEDALYVVKQPAVWKLAYKLAAEEGKEVFTFLKSLRAMKLAMQEGKLKAGVIVAEKI
jgi:tocopherol O-methyltransferase